MSDGIMGLYCGSSRMGKTHALKSDIKKRKWKRVIVWSVKEQIDKYHELAKPLGITCFVAQNTAELVQAIDGNKKRNALIIYTPRKLEDFDFFCRAAFTWGKFKKACIVVEETADVTTPSKAPDAYGVMIRQCLGWGCDLYAVSQRPAESDKTVMGNCTYVHAHFMKRADDRKYIAKELDCDPQILAEIPKYHWVESWSGERELRHGGGKK